MTIDIINTRNIINATAASLSTSSPYYDTQLAVQNIPGLEMATLAVASKSNGVQDAVILGVRLGVYLALRQVEIDRLKN
jgi:hypothetical protein